MPMRSLVGRWCLLVLLVLGVVCMHHTPVAHGVMHASGPAAVTAHDSHVMKPGGSAMSGDAGASAMTAPAAGDAHLAGHDMLHLCLAILFAAAALLAFLVLRARRLPAAAEVRCVNRAGIGRYPPPVPVPRRLAALCVFRL